MRVVSLDDFTCLFDLPVSYLLKLLGATVDIELLPNVAIGEVDFSCDLNLKIPHSISNYAHNDDLSLSATLLNRTLSPREYEVDLEIAIRHDDVAELERITTLPAIDEIQTLHLSNPPGYKDRLEYSCYCDSMRCFRFLMINHIVGDIPSSNAVAMAIFSGNVEMIYTLFDRDFPVSWAAYCSAVASFRPEILEWLIALYPMDQKELTEDMLSTAFRTPNYGAIVQYGSNLSADDSWLSNTCMVLAAKARDYDLISHGIGIGMSVFSGENGNSLMDFVRGDRDCTELLLENGFNPNSFVFEPFTCNNPECSDILFEYGANPDLCFTQCTLRDATSSIDIIDLGGVPNAQSLHWAALAPLKSPYYQFDSTEFNVLVSLLVHGADPNGPNLTGVFLFLI